MSTPPAEGYPPSPVNPTPAATPASQPRAGGRPIVVTLAVLLMVPTLVTWLIAGIAFFRAMLRTEGDAKFLVVIIGVFVLGIALILVLMSAMGMLMAWKGAGAEGLSGPATFTFGLFVVVIVVLLVQGKLSFEPTMVTPLIVGALAGVALALIRSRPATAWFASRKR